MVPGTTSPDSLTADGRGVFHPTGHADEDPMTSNATPLSCRIDALRATALALSLCATLAACDRSPASTATAPTASTAAAPAATPAASVVPAELIGVAETAVPVPTEEAVLAAYGAKAGTTLADGRDVGFWRGYAYRVAGRDRYTAFVDAAAAGESGMPQPEQQADIAQVTFTLRDGVWQPATPQTGVGRFGGMGRAPEADAGRIELTYTVAPDKALLVLPSATVATGGVRVRGHEVFLYAAADGAWRHLGTVQSGVDYSASCRQGPSTPDTECVRNNGSLRFEAPAAGGMPDIIVSFTGSTRGDDGAIRAAGPADTRTYRYDAATSTYIDGAAP
jgi:hypothetical protein